MRRILRNGLLIASAGLVVAGFANACAAGGTADSSSIGPSNDASAERALADTASPDSVVDITHDTSVPDAPPADASIVDALGADATADSAPTCTESDAGCATTNPGACSPGVLLCDGGAGFCQPLVSSQACYSGPANTRGVGVCSDGTQSCLGSLGACMGEVVPATVENCFNTLDDDCDGVVNDGCPSSLALGADRALTPAGGAGGGASTVHCAPGAFVTRVDSWFDDSDRHASGVSIYCATPALLQEASYYSVVLTPSTPAPYARSTGTTSPTDERDDDCGTSGLTAITDTTGLSDTYVEALGSHCSTSSVTLSANNTITFDFPPSGDTSYNSFSNPSGSFFEQACATNEVVVGFNLHDGAWLDNIAVVCAALTVNYIQ